MAVKTITNKSLVGQRFSDNQVKNLYCHHIQDNDIIIFPENYDVHTQHVRGSNLKAEFLYVDVIRGEKHIKIPFYPSIFTMRVATCDDHGYLTGFYISTSGHVVANFDKYPTTDEFMKFLGHQSKLGNRVIVKMTRCKCLRNGAEEGSKPTNVNVPTFNFVDLEDMYSSYKRRPLNLAQEHSSIINFDNILYAKIAIYSILRQYKFSIEEISAISYFLKAKLGNKWMWTPMHNHNLEWDSKWVNFFYRELDYDRRTRPLNVNDIIEDIPVYLSHHDIYGIGLDFSHAFSANGNTDWTPQFIEKHKDELNFSQLSSNRNVKWTMSLIACFENDIDWKCLLTNPSAELNQFIIEIAKQKTISFNDDLVSNVIAHHFIPSNINNLFIELEVFIKMLRPDLTCKSSCVIKGLSRNEHIIWPQNILEHAIQNGFVDLEELASAAIHDVKHKIRPISLSEETLINNKLIRNSPFTARIPIKDYWTIEKIKKVFRDDLDNFISLIENPCITFTDEIVEYLYNAVGNSEYLCYQEILFDLEYNPSYYEYLEGKYGKSVMLDILLNALTYLPDAKK